MGFVREVDDVRGHPPAHGARVDAHFDEAVRLFVREYCARRECERKRECGERCYTVYGTCCDRCDRAGRLDERITPRNRSAAFPAAAFFQGKPENRNKAASVDRRLAGRAIRARTPHRARFAARRRSARSRSEIAAPTASRSFLHQELHQDTAARSSASSAAVSCSHVASALSSLARSVSRRAPSLCACSTPPGFV